MKVVLADEVDTILASLPQDINTKIISSSIDARGDITINDAEQIIIASERLYSKTVNLTLNSVSSSNQFVQRPKVKNNLKQRRCNICKYTNHSTSQHDDSKLKRNPNKKNVKNQSHLKGTVKAACFICGKFGHYSIECPHKGSFNQWKASLNCVKDKNPIMEGFDASNVTLVNNHIPIETLKITDDETKFEADIEMDLEN